MLAAQMLAERHHTQVVAVQQARQRLAVARSSGWVGNLAVRENDSSQLALG